MSYLKKFKHVALVVLFTFSFQVLGIPNLALALLPSTASANLSDPILLFGKKTKETNDALRAIRDGLAKGQDETPLLNAARVKLSEILSLKSAVETKLGETGKSLDKLLQGGKIPQKVLDRHKAFVDKTADGFNKLAGVASNLNAIIARGTALPGDIEPLLGTVEKLAPKPESEIIGNKPQLPHRRTDIEKRDIEPRPAVTPGVNYYTVQDLAPTKDIQITQEIKDLANKLFFDPSEIFSYVRNKVDYQPYFGSVKGSAGAYWEKAGNDIDQASLLIALFRASNIPARYVSGVVELPIEKVMNWTGTKTPDTAVHIMRSNGVPSMPVTSADGTVTRLKLFHTWAEAYIPVSSKGAKSTAKEWVQLDPSFKQYDYVEGIDLKQAMGFDLNSFYNSATAGATINQGQSSFTGLNETNINSDIRTYADNLLSWVNTNMPGATVGDVLGSRKIRQANRQELNNLSQSFPFKTFTPQFELSELPDFWRYNAAFLMYDFTYFVSMPELYGKKLTISYVPATPYDQWLIDYFGGIFNVPAYLVQLKTQLKLEGQVVAEGGAGTLGMYQVFRSAFLRPLSGNWDINDKWARTGANYSVSLDHQRISLDLLKQRVQKFDNLIRTLPGGTVNQEVIEEALHLTGLVYFAETDVFSDVAGKTSKVSWQREPSQDFIVQDLTVWYIWGIPYMVGKGTVGMDVKRNPVNPTSQTGNRKDETSWMLTSGSIGSATEHAVFEQLYGIESVSTEKILTLANRQGIPIYTIDRSNIDQILPNLDISPSVIQNIYEMVVYNGWTAVVPQRNVQLNQWYGQGWIVMDPQTGSAGYMISGGLISGSEMAAAGGSGTTPADITNFMRQGFNPVLEALLGLADTGLGFAYAGARIATAAFTAGEISGAWAAVGVGATVGVGVVMIAIAGYLLYKNWGSIFGYNRQRNRRWYGKGFTPLFLG